MEVRPAARSNVFERPRFLVLRRPGCVQWNCVEELEKSCYFVGCGFSVRRSSLHQQFLPMREGGTLRHRWAMRAAI